jgi:hypothetical protein
MVGSGPSFLILHTLPLLWDGTPPDIGVTNLGKSGTGVRRRRLEELLLSYSVQTVSALCAARYDERGRESIFIWVTFLNFLPNFTPFPGFPFRYP